MTVISAQIVAELMAAGLSDDALIAALRRIEEASQVTSQPSSGALRTKRWRDKRASQTVTVTSPPVTSDAATETQKETSPIPPKEKTISLTNSSCARGDEEGDPIAEAVETWNSLAHDFGLSKVQRLTDERKTKLRARLRDCGGLAGWAAAMGKIRGSPFLTGGNDTGWRADFDFVLQAKSFTKLMEGGYDERTPRKQTGTGGLSAAYAAFDERVGARGEGTGHR